MSKEQEAEAKRAKQERWMKAELRRLKRLVKHYEKEGDATARIVRAVQTSVEAMPEVVVPTTIELAGSEHDETVMLMLSDLHIGKKTATYNPRAFVKRLRKLEAAMMSIVTALRSGRPLKKLVILMNGDKQIVS